jgi:hypothetical protein
MRVGKSKQSDVDVCVVAGSDRKRAPHFVTVKCHHILFVLIRVEGRRRRADLLAAL